MLRNLARALGVDAEKRELERLNQKIQTINELENSFSKFSQETLIGKTDEFRQRLSNGETLDDLLPEAFAAVREASKRTIGLRHFDIQLIGGIVLHEGKIAEMRTGEGKTLVATLALYLNALGGKGAHLVTVNDYLARRDARWMAPIYSLLGLHVGVLQMSSRSGSTRDAYLVNLDKRDSREENDQLQLVPRSQAYFADITYGTNNEYGFDYLRDNLVMDINQRVQRSHHYAIIDEVDNILIDEARTPLIISGPASEDVAWYSRMSAIVKQLEPQDYDFDEKDRSIALTEIGEIHVEELLNMPLRDPDRPEDITQEQARLLGFLEQALRAQLLFRKNKDYIVQNGEVVIVDEFTGRLMPGRRWSEGLHQAVEAKEGVNVKPENVTHATITLQNYFRKYEKLAGMTGTAITEAEEFGTIYNLEVIEIPTNLDFEASKPSSELEVLQEKDSEGYEFTYYTRKEDSTHMPIFWKRKDYPDIVYRNEEGKLRAIALEILRFHLIGRPQLVGTSSIEHSERLSKRLKVEHLRRLLLVEVIRQTFFRKNQIEIVEKAYPDLAFLYQPLPDLNLAEMRQFAQSLGLQNLNLESAENLQILLNYLGLEDTFTDRLKSAVRGGIPHNVLNALKHDQESQIIAGAGAFGAVTIATNMAGRGVDIKLGGELDETILAYVKKYLSQNGISPYGLTNTEIAQKLKGMGTPESEELRDAVQTFLDHIRNMRKVRELGGLHVIGSERHEARRIDNQLRGRSGRQGDPGSSRFYLSLEDDLMRMFGGERAENMMRLFNLDLSVPLESRMLGRLVEGAQERVEGSNFDIRKHLLDYDDVLNDQRERIYGERDRVLVKKDLEEDVLEMLRTELLQRIPFSLEDPEGPWKLIAFLEEIQPTIFFGESGERIISYPMVQIQQLLLTKISDISNRDEIQAAALELAQEALQSERKHIINQTASYLARTEENFKNQLKERLELLDIFTDNLDQYESVPAREVKEALQAQIGLKLDLDTAQIKNLLEEEAGGNHPIQEIVKKNLAAVFLSRLKFAIERRVESRLALDIDSMSELDWPQIEEKFIEVVDRVFQDKAATLTREGNQIDHNIQTILNHQAEAKNKSFDLVALAANMGIGTQAMINSQTHKRVKRKVNLLNFIYLAAANLELKSPEDITIEVMAHLEKTQQSLRRIWGKLELEQLSHAYDRISELPTGYLKQIEEYLHESPGSTFGQMLLADILTKGEGDFFEAFSQSMQARIYRHILLQEISNLWMEHLTKMEALRVSIRMEAYAQRDPLVQYKSVSTDTFRDLLSAIRMGVISKMFRMQPAKRKPNVPEIQTNEPQTGSSSKNSSKKKRKRHSKH